MKWISTTIKRVYLDKILNGEKTVEMKAANEFWTCRLSKLMGKDDVGLNLLCGRICHKFKVRDIAKVTIGRTYPPQDIDGVPARSFFEILIGDEISKESSSIAPSEAMNNLGGLTDD